ncbi:hypothetical protein J6590_055411 [Homalodisca vitripennis]|nr:hypothetical protein J6590_055411 [Homalodisca vitripennis]
MLPKRVDVSLILVVLAQAHYHAGIDEWHQQTRLRCYRLIERCVSQPVKFWRWHAVAESTDQFASASCQRHYSRRFAGALYWVLGVVFVRFWFPQRVVLSQCCQLDRVARLSPTPLDAPSLPSPRPSVNISVVCGSIFRLQEDPKVLKIITVSAALQVSVWLNCEP